MTKQLIRTPLTATNLSIKLSPTPTTVRKINELVKRVRISKVHAYIISHLKEQMPMMMGFAKKQKQLIENLPAVFRTVMKVSPPPSTNTDIKTLLLPHILFTVSIFLQFSICSFVSACRNTI